VDRDHLHSLLALDRSHVWHPYGPMPGTADPLLVTEASGVRLTVAGPDGAPRELIDGMSSWWAAIHGYRHPRLDAAARAQLGRMAHVMFGGLTNEPAIELAAKLVAITPEPLRHVFLADSGSVSVEVAVKMCLQYWRSLGRPGKRRLLTWRGGYHGDTFQPMSVCDPEGGMHSLWRGVLPEQVFADEPPAGFEAAPDPRYLGHLADLMARHAHELAAVIVEPVVQGAGGMRFHSPGYLTALRSLCDEHDVLLVFDEIATGFGRSGALFAAGHAGTCPDVMCVGKALTGGYLTMAAALCTGRVAEGISRGEVPVLAHGPTFMGNPLAAAVANASIDLLLDDAAWPAAPSDLAAGAPGDPAAGGGSAVPGWQRAVRRIEAGLRSGLAPAAELPGVLDWRVLGAIGVVQLDHPVDLAAATRAAVDHGVWLRPFRDLIYTMPPYITPDRDLAAICSAVLAAAAV
jgi:adenosylmethionine---8-amino-7-oxononanoate aminotransferase